MAQRQDLNVEARTSGKHFSRALRRDRKIPAVIYGVSTENKNICIDENAVLKFNTRAYENTLFNLKSSDSKVNGIVVLMKDVVVHPLSRKPQHVDLFALDMKKAIRLAIEVRLEGKPIGLSEGGLLNVVNRQIEIECLPTEIPEFFTADISNLGIGDAIHVNDVQVPKNVKVVSGADLTICVVNLQEEEVLETPVAAAADAAAPAAGAAAPAAGAKPAPGAAPAPAAGAKAPAAPAKK